MTIPFTLDATLVQVKDRYRGFPGLRAPTPNVSGGHQAEIHDRESVLIPSVSIASLLSLKR